MSSTEEVKHLQIPLQELLVATDGFSERNLIAKGGFGKVYKGVTVKHGDIAVKVLDPEQGQGEHEFKTEIALLSVHKHENIVSLVGSCDEDGKKILVYKYETNGSLDKHLKSRDLTWIRRLHICLNAARGLQYLHDDVGSAYRILHRDIKSSNILLDENWTAKIADFGLSKIGPANAQSTFLISNACGTFGYIDPDYMNTGYLTQKSDVYSFGVVLFEVLCGRLTRVPEYKDKGEFLITLVKIHWGRKTLHEIIYCDIHEQINRASLLTFTSIAYQCLMSGNERPTMKKVLEQLQKALDIQLELFDVQVDDDHGFAAHHQGQPRSLASSSESIPSSSSESWMYDVFISFEGEDTRTTFVDHLYAALVNRQIIPYKDDVVLPRDENAIQESRIVIIVFSKKYASSSWCLDELMTIMGIWDERGQTVIPIFYDVEPEVVRRQTGSFGEAFDMHKLSNKNNKEVESWSKALRNAANLDGLELQNGNWHEPKFIKMICEEISYRLLKLMPRREASVNTSANTYLTGIETRMQELKSLLEKVGSGGVGMVGICGMWGSGKSTLASYIYDKISHEFEGCCFVKDVKARSRVHGLKVLQEEVLSNVLNLEVTFTNTEQGIDMMKSSLRQNRALIILDDVDHIDQLKMLAGSKTWFGNGSRIIFTTRKEYLVNAHNSITHNVRMLDDTEALELLSKHAFGKSKPIQGFEDLSLTMVSNFGGHPVALTDEDLSLTMVSNFGGHPVALTDMGSHLHGREISVWMSILDGLKGSKVAQNLKWYKKRDHAAGTNVFYGFHPDNAAVLS